MANSYDNDDKLYELLRHLIHDLKSPLSCLMMWNNYSKSLPPEEKMSVTGSISRLRDAIDVAEKKLYKKKISTTQLNIHNLIQEILMEKKVEYRVQDVDILYNIPENSQDINIDDVKDDFSRMLSNLLNNAIEACNSDHNGTIKIILSKSNNIITLSITDNGRGMSEEILQKLKNGETITHGKKHGHGIGMQQIRNVISKLHGRLDIQSTLSKGSVFILEFNPKDY